MSEFNNITLTNAGKIILAKAIAGKPLKFSRVVCGDGVAEYEDIKEIEELNHELYDLKIYSCEVISSQGIAKLEAVLDNKNIASSFYVREIGIFVEDPDTGEEILYGYGNFSEESDYMPLHGGIEDVEFFYKFYIAIDQAANITVNGLPGNLYVTQDELNNMFDESATVKEFWTRTDGDGRKFRPLGIQQVRVAVMGIQNLEKLQKQIDEVAEATILNSLKSSEETDFEIPSHEQLEGLLGGNGTGHYHLTEEEYNAFQNIKNKTDSEEPAFEIPSHEQLEDLLGGNGTGHYHLTEEEYSVFQNIKNKTDNTENWTFTLEDGSTVTKTVHIS